MCSYEVLGRALLCFFAALCPALAGVLVFTPALLSLSKSGKVHKEWVEWLCVVDTVGIDLGTCRDNPEYLPPHLFQGPCTETCHQGNDADTSAMMHRIAGTFPKTPARSLRHHINGRTHARRWSTNRTCQGAVVWASVRLEGGMSEQNRCAYRWGSKKRTALYGDWRLGDPLPISTDAAPQACYVNRKDICKVAFEPEQSSDSMSLKLRVSIAAVLLVFGFLAGASSVHTGCAVFKEPIGKQSKGRQRYEPLLFHEGNELAFAADNRQQMERAATQIQSAWRGQAVRKRTRVGRPSNLSVFLCGWSPSCRTPRIQWPGPCPKPCSATKRAEALHLSSGERHQQDPSRDREERAAVRIQANYRGCAARKKVPFDRKFQGKKT